MPPSIKEDKGINAILRFYEQGKADEVKKHPRWQDCAKIPGCNLTFRLTGETQLIPEREVVVQFQKLLLSQPENTNENTENIGRCLITGEREFIARLHTPTFIQGGKSSARLVAFQKSSGYDSYGKEQGFNAPISVRAESAYTTALKHLLASKTNKQTISDATIIFWAEKRIDEKTFNLENNFAWYIADKTDDPDLGVRAVKSLYNAVYTGRLSKSIERFYVLALAPNAARISVRFFRQGTIKEFGEKIKMHFDDFEIVRSPRDSEYLSLYRILTSTALQYKIDNVPPNLASAVIESVLDGTVSNYAFTAMYQKNSRGTKCDTGSCNNFKSDN